MPEINRAVLERRLAELKEARDDLGQQIEQAMEQYKGLAGAIVEVEGYWLPYLEQESEKEEPALTLDELQEVIDGKPLPFALGENENGSSGRV